MYAIPLVDNIEKDSTHVYQGVGVRNLDKAILQGWTPVKIDDKIGTNWSEGPTGFRMYGEQVLCRMTVANHNKLAAEIESMKEVLTIEGVESEYREQAGSAAYGEVSDG